MATKYHTLISRGFLMALAILLLNDFLFKPMFSNWTTGKLSDFAGLFVFSIFWANVFPKFKTAIFWITGVMFFYWKSSYSQDLIDCWNQLGLFGVQRTIDYTDGIALLILPFAYWYDQKAKQTRIINISPAIPIALAAFSFMATSYYSQVSINQNYHFDFSRDTLYDRMQKIDSLHIGPELNVPKNKPDTLQLQMPSQFCFRSVDVKIVVSNLNTTSCDLTLLSVEHRCPSKDSDASRLIQEFEKKVLDKVRH